MKVESTNLDWSLCLGNRTRERLQIKSVDDLKTDTPDWHGIVSFKTEDSGGKMGRPIYLHMERYYSHILFIKNQQINVSENILLFDCEARSFIFVIKKYKLLLRV